MQTLKQTSVLKFTTFFFFSFLAMAALFSCSKDKADGIIAKTADPARTISEHASGRSSSTNVPYDWNFFVPCANGGAGEWVRVTGSTNLVYTISWTDHGFTYGYHSNTYGIKAVGLTSGETFIGSGHTEGQVMGAWVNEQWLSTFVDEIRLIGQTTSFSVRNTYHVTVNPDGDEEIKLNDHEIVCN